MGKGVSFVVLKPVKQDKLYKKIVEQIKNLIMEGNLRPGERLPPERDLAEKLNVSRVAVREALLTLEFMGLVEIKRGSGVFIPEELQPELVLNSIDFALNFKENIVEDLVEVRQILETKMAGLAAKKADKEDILEIEKKLKNFELQVKQGKEGTNESLEFHLSIARATKNVIFFRLLNQLKILLVQSGRLSSKSKERPLIALKQHFEIFEAIRKKDVKRAEEVMANHLEGIRNIFKISQ